MFDLTIIQNTAFRLLGGSGFFLRINAGNESLFISDYPRRCHAAPPEKLLLAELGLVCCIDPQKKMLLLDFSTEKYESLQQPVTVFPQPPNEETLFSAYALCRLLLAHPCPVSVQPMDLNRQLIKTLYTPCNAHSFDEMMLQCSKLLRQKRPLPYLGGVLLARWLIEKGEKIC